MSQNKMVTKSDLASFYQAILPYLGGQIQSNWSQSDNTEVDFIKNKPAVDAWAGTRTVSGDGTFSFNFLDDTQGWAYKPYVEVTGSSTNKNPTAQISSIAGAGTSSMTINYTTDADSGATVKLRIIK
jgi:hypothetical protein